MPFVESDILALARAVANLPHEPGLSTFDNNTERCVFCGVEVEEHFDFKNQRHVMPALKHELNCPTLIARDMLTGFE